MNIWRSLLASLPLTLTAHTVQPIQTYELEGIVTRVEDTNFDVDVPIYVGQSFTGTLMYHPESAMSAGGSCTINAFSYHLNVGSVSIRSGTNSVTACLADRFINDIDGPTSDFPAGQWFRELLWSGIDVDSAFPERIPASAFLASQWSMLWLSQNSWKRFVRPGWLPRSPKFRSRHRSCSLLQHSSSLWPFRGADSSKRTD